MSAAIFFDKDGVLNPDEGVIWPRTLPPSAGVGDLIAQCRTQGYQIFIITNRTEVARGLASEAEITQTLAIFAEQIRQQNGLAQIDQIYFCPHHPHATNPLYRQACRCRKPYPALIEKALHTHQLDPQRSFFVGDRLSDVVAGNLAGLKTIYYPSAPVAAQTLIASSLEIADLPISKREPWQTIRVLTDLLSLIPTIPNAPYQGVL